MNDREQVENSYVWAWMGEDDSTPPAEPGVVGIKQGITPSGTIPLASCVLGKIEQGYIRQQQQLFAMVTGKRRFLVRFRFDAIEEVIE